MFYKLPTFSFTDDAATIIDIVKITYCRLKINGRIFLMIFSVELTSGKSNFKMNINKKFINIKI